MDKNITTIPLGDIELTLINTGNYWTDGGACYGIIPRPIWEKITPPDELGRVELAVNVLLIKTAKYNILVDTGYGTKLPDKAKSIFNIKQNPNLPGQLENSGTPPDKIDFVVLTHLHFDHAGGLTYRDEADKLRLTFPDAVHIVQAREWEEANHPNERNRAAYIPDDFLLLKESGRLKLVDGAYRVYRGVSTVVSGGHTLGHQSVRIVSQRQPAIFMGDIMPTRHNIKLPFISAYDSFPLHTLEEKRNIFRRSAKRNRLIILGHEIEHPAGYVSLDEKGQYVYRPINGRDGEEL